MKFLYSKYIQQADKILKLRFGIDRPPEHSSALFSRSVVSKYLQIPENSIESIEKLYFRNLKKKCKIN